MREVSKEVADSHSYELVEVDEAYVGDEMYVAGWFMLDPVDGEEVYVPNPNESRDMLRAQARAQRGRW